MGAGANLVDPNRLGESFDAVLAQVDDLVSFERGSCELVSLPRDENLAAVPCRGDARSEVYVLADVALRTTERLAGV